MSSTNKTPNLDLSQFLGTDKPAWLGDYNSDMQKIDDAFANLEQGGQSSAADIAALQQKDVELEQSITDVNDRVDTAFADVITLGNRTTVLEGNYDTMHHELVLLDEKMENKVDNENGSTTDLKLITNHQRQFSKDLIKGTMPQNDTYMEYHFMDSTNGALNKNDFSKISTGVLKNGSVITTVNTFLNEADSSTRATLSIAINADGTKYATAPTPNDVNDNSNKIATTEWVYGLLRNLGLIN